MVSKNVNMAEYDLIWFPNMLIWLNMTWYDFQICQYDWIWLDMVSKYVNMTEYDLTWFPNMLIWQNMTWYGFQIC